MSKLDNQEQTPKTAAEMQRMRKGRNMALLGIIVGLVVLFYVLTLVKVGGAS
jgi:flagellar biosynthesis/type III secretory pathway M-ring protein FliF/YscJ